jgi:hypothetical protein
MAYANEQYMMNRSMLHQKMKEKRYHKSKKRQGSEGNRLQGVQDSRSPRRIGLKTQSCHDSQQTTSQTTPCRLSKGRK